MKFIADRIRGLVAPYAIAIIAVCIAASMVMLLNLHNKRVDRAVLAERHGWELKLASANALISRMQSEAIARINVDDNKTMVTIAEQQDRIRSLEGDLEFERAKVPLSSGCDACRIPASRILGR